MVFGSSVVELFLEYLRTTNFNRCSVTKKSCVSHVCEKFFQLILFLLCEVTGGSFFSLLLTNDLHFLRHTSAIILNTCFTSTCHRCQPHSQWHLKQRTSPRVIKPSANFVGELRAGRYGTIREPLLCETNESEARVRWVSRTKNPSLPVYFAGFGRGNVIPFSPRRSIIVLISSILKRKSAKHFCSLNRSASSKYAVKSLFGTHDDWLMRDSKYYRRLL